MAKSINVPMTARKIREFRKARRWTQQDLGDLLGISSIAVSKWEREVCLPSLETAVNMAELWHVPVRAFVILEEEESDWGREEERA